jgi:hypothetical protein
VKYVTQRESRIPFLVNVCKMTPKTTTSFENVQIYQTKENCRSDIPFANECNCQDNTRKVYDQTFRHYLGRLKTIGNTLNVVILLTFDCRKLASILVTPQACGQTFCIYSIYSFYAKVSSYE